MRLTKSQKTIRDMIVKECTAAGLTTQETAIVLGTAYKESSFDGDKKGTSRTEYGLFQYNKPSWETYHKNDGDRSDPINQTRAFIEDFKQYKSEYETDKAAGKIKPPDMSLGEYAYNKHMHGPNTDWVYGRDVNGDGIWDVSPASKEWQKVQGKLQEFEDYANQNLSDGSINDTRFGDINGPFLPWWLNNSLQDLMNKETGLYRQFFTTAGTIPPPSSCPLILDLDRDGIETTNVKDGAYFDHDGNGFAEQTGWAGADDGLLVMDRDANGIRTVGAKNETFSLVSAYWRYFNSLCDYIWAGEGDIKSIQHRTAVRWRLCAKRCHSQEVPNFSGWHIPECTLHFFH